MENVHPFPRDQGDDHDGFTRMPPVDIEAERSTLGGCIHYPRHIPRVAQTLTGADFYRPAHETIWHALLDLHTEGKPTDPIALTIELDRRGDLKRVGGPVYVTQLADYVGGGDPAYFAERVRERADLRAEEELGRRIVQQATAPDAEPGRIVHFIDDYLERQKERSAGRSGDPADALLAELLDASSLDNMPTLEPLVGDLLHLDSLARVVGPSGHMKSFMVIDFAGHVGTGMKWHGQYVRQGTVVYLVAEGARGIRKRVRAWEKHHGLKMDNVLFLPRPVQAMSPEWDTLIEAMRRLQPSLIVIDTQARVSVGVEENSAKELGLVVDRMEKLRAATAACVLVIHHTGHVGEHGRGSSSAKGALQSELHVSKKGDNAKNIIVTLKTGKQKDDEEGDDLQFGLRLVTLDGEYKPDGRPVTSVVLESLDLSDRGPVPGTAAYIAQQLDTAGVPAHHGRDRLRSECVRLGIQARTELLAEVARLRRARGQVGDRSDLHLSDEQASQEPRHHQEALEAPGDTGQNTTEHLSPNLSPPNSAQPVPKIRTETDETPGQTCPGQVWDSTGQAVNTPVPSSLLPGRGQVGQPAPLCTVCHNPLHGYRADRGYDTCLSCDPTTGSHPDTAA